MARITHSTKPPDRARIGPSLLVTALVAALLLAGAAGGAVVWLLMRGKVGHNAMVAASTAMTAVPPNRLTLSPLVERVAPAVVNIAVLQTSPLDENPLL